MIRIVIVDKHAVYRKSLRLILEQHPDMSVIADAGDGLAAVELVKLHTPDVLLADVILPGLDGFEVTKIVASQHPATKVVLLTLFTDDGTRVKALEAGAYHCFAKDGRVEGMFAVIRECCQQPLRDALNHLVRSHATSPYHVSVEELKGAQFKTFLVKVGIADYNHILSMMDVIKTSAMRIAGVDERFIVNLVLNKSSLVERHSRSPATVGPTRPLIPDQVGALDREQRRPKSLQGCLDSLVKSLVQKRDAVVVIEVLPDRGYEIKVALMDYHVILSKLNVIKSLAMKAAGVPEGAPLIVNLVVNESGPR